MPAEGCVIEDEFEALVLIQLSSAGRRNAVWKRKTLRCLRYVGEPMALCSLPNAPLVAPL